MRTIIPYSFLLFFLLSTFSSYAQKTTGIKEIDDGISQISKGNDRKGANILLKALQRYPNNYEANYDLGLTLLHLGQNDSALTYFSKAVSIDPAAPEAYINRALVYFILKDSAKGEADQRISVSLKPALAEAFANLGSTLDAKGKHEQAIAYFDSAIAINKYFYNAYMNKSAAYYTLGRHDDAIEVLNTLIPLKPPHLANAYYNRASEFYEIGEIPAALEDCEKAIELDSKDADSYILRSKIKDAIGDEHGAVDDVTLAIRLDSTNAEYYNTRAVRRFDLKDYEGIIADCNKALALKPDHYDALIQRGDAYDELNKFTEAAKDYDRAIAIQPLKFDAYRERAASAIHEASVTNGGYKDAQKFIDKALLLKPNDMMLLQNKYSAYWIMKDYQAAFATIDQCIKLIPDSAGHYYLLKAQLYDSLHDYESACKNAYEALKKNVGDGYSYIASHTCESYKQMPLVKAVPFITKSDEKRAIGNYYAEIEALTQVIELLPDNAASYYNRGLAKRHMNKFNEAIEDYTKAIVLKPKFTDAILSRGIAKSFLNDVEGAMEDYKLAIKADSTYSMAYFNYGNILEETDAETAIKYYSKAIQLDRRYAKAYLHRGELYIKLSKKEEACRDFNRAYELGLMEGKGKSLLYCK